MTLTLILAVVAGIAVLLFLSLRLKINAFIALLIGSITVGLIAGLNAKEIIQTIQEGMGSTLGFVATVVGLGAMFGAILEASGGAKAIANFTVSKFIKNMVKPDYNNWEGKSEYEERFMEIVTNKYEF